MKKFLEYVFYLIFIVWLVIIINLAKTINIHPDEAYYFSWSEYLRSGYLDHPPAIAYIIKLSSLIFKENFTIRGVNILLSILSLFFAGASIKQLWGKKEYIQLALFLASFSPLFITGTIIATPDTPLVFSFSAYIYFALLSIEITNGNNSSKKNIYFYSTICGVFLGFAMLSKYSAFLIIISLIVFWIRFRNNSKIVKFTIFIPILTAVIIYLPNLIYNIQNEYKSYLFQISHAISNPSFNPFKTFLPFVLSQMFLFSPFIFVFFFLKINFLRKEKDINKHFLFILTIVPFTIFTFLSFFKHIEANWAAFAFLPLLIIIIPEILKSPLRIIMTLIYQSLVFIIIVLHIKIGILPIKTEFDPLTQIKYWDKTFNLIKDNIPKDYIVVTFRYQLSSILYYYSNRQIISMCLDRRFITSEIGINEAQRWAMIDFFPAKTANDIALNICPDRVVRIPLVISDKLNIIRRIDIIYCQTAFERKN